MRGKWKLEGVKGWSMYPVKSVTNLMEVSQRETELGGGRSKGCEHVPC